MGEAALGAQDVTKRYGGRAALRGVSLAVVPGEVLAVIGPNGAGKTTLLSILAALLAPTSGTLARPGREVGRVPQHPAVYGKLSVRENLALYARLERVPDVERSVARMLEQTGLADRADEELARLSGGNRQRVNIAVGLLSEPPALLLDEPSASLDPRQRERLWGWLSALARQGTAIVFTTHDVAEAERWAHRVLVLADGEAVFAGSAAQLRMQAGGGPADLEAAFVRFLAERGH